MFYSTIFAPVSLCVSVTTGSICCFCVFPTVTLFPQTVAWSLSCLPHDGIALLALVLSAKEIGQPLSGTRLGESVRQLL